MCKCQSIGKMKKTRKSSANGILMETGAIAAGLAAGSLVVPKILDMVIGDKAIDPNLTNGGVAAVAVFGAMRTKGAVQSGLIGLAAGSALKVIMNFAGLQGIGEEYYNNSYDLNYVAEGNPFKIPGSPVV